MKYLNRRWAQIYTDKVDPQITQITQISLWASVTPLKRRKTVEPGTTSLALKW